VLSGEATNTNFIVVGLTYGTYKKGKTRKHQIQSSETCLIKTYLWNNLYQVTFIGELYPLGLKVQQQTQ
jgi:hypothetical protein